MVAHAAVSSAEAANLFQDLRGLPAILLAVSGGPDSTALMLLAAQWRAALPDGPKLVAATVDHRLRPEAAAEARAVAELARSLALAHVTLRWTGAKPASGLQEAARIARYELLAQAARKAGSPVIVTAHTLDDQAETVLLRLARGSGLSGLAGMRRVTSLPAVGPRFSRNRGRTGLSAEGRGEAAGNVQIIRPLLSIPKSRLIATLRAENIPFADDPSNRDPRFTRTRLRQIMPVLAQEGLDARRLALLAERFARADAALEEATQRTYERLAERPRTGLVRLPAADVMALSDEIRLRVLGGAIAEVGDEGPVELGKLEALHAALLAAYQAAPLRHLRRSLAGAIVTLDPRFVGVERAPPRRRRALTSSRSGSDICRKSR